MVAKGVVDAVLPVLVLCGTTDGRARALAAVCDVVVEIEAELSPAVSHTEIQLADRQGHASTVGETFG